MTLMRLFCLPFLLLSCSLATQPPLQLTGLEGMQISFTERDWDWVREASPRHFLEMEKELSKNPEQPRLRANLIRSYSLYATLVFETLALEEKILDERKYYRDRALKLHQKAVELGEVYLKGKNLKLESLQLSDEELIPLLYMAKSQAALSFHASEPAIKAKVIYDLICPKLPAVEAGECPLFYARFELSNSPQTARAIYQRFLKDNPYHLLARAFYIEFALIDLKNEEEFSDQFMELEDGIRKWQEGAGPRELNLLNATAKMRFRVLQRYRRRIF